MSDKYPVVTGNVLEPVPAKKFLGPKRIRDIEQIPRCGSHQRLIYRVGNDYVLDNGALSMDSDTVLEATHVSLIDMSRDAEVPVIVGISSQDAGSFQLRVVFTCTVTDPVEALRGGTEDLGSVLRAYVRKHPRFAELGLDFDLREINPARRKITPQIRAYVMAVPPVYRGIRTELASVEILTPPPVENYHEQRRDSRDKHEIEFEYQTNEQVKRSAARSYDHTMELRAQQHELELDANRRDYQRHQFRQHSGIADDPMAALEYAYSVGDITARQLAEERLKREDADREFMREESVRAREWERASIDRRDEQESLISRHKRETERLDLMEEWRVEHKRLELAAEDARQKHDMQRELLRKALDANIIDPLNLEQIMHVMFSSDSDRTKTGELQEAEVMESIDAGKVDDIEDAAVREEDDH
ncbi:hypothetical protein OG225_34175 [Nocardia sp. NBC_01377]|uniref:hypothetical protein n=1 Tax=Nocardia sp. NBC_01377 TaxID=2903595 RepID=UPI0032561B80